MILESSCFLIKFINFNWRIIALQYHVGLCHTSTQISHRYTYVLSSPSHLPPLPIPLHCYRDLVWVPESHSKCLLAIYFTYGSVDVETTCFIDEETEVKPLNSPCIISTLFAVDPTVSLIWIIKIIYWAFKRIKQTMYKSGKTMNIPTVGKFFSALSKIEMWIMTIWDTIFHIWC